ncbi:putative late blight resistance protein homolog R1B-11 [Nicotiana sylvestris]|uniref:putative late blight resistance protein homolog R1B-11 n=1 Tax=Nicotiana sylvestris TaxID=4096 RepID=UPI00388CA4ED
MELWASEGFLKVGEMKSIEEVAKKYLKELIDRSLICIHNLSFDGEVESCWMHDVIRELCLREARNMNFVNVLRAKSGQTPCLQSTHFSSISRVRISVHLARYPDIEDLYGWNPWYCNGSLFFPNLKKLQIRGIGEDFSSCKDLYDFHCLDQLEELEFCLAYRNVDAACFLETLKPSGATSQDLLRRLKFSMESPSLPLLPTDDALPHLLLPPPGAFPQRLKKLAFSGTSLRWMDLSIVGKLPKLEVLKLENDACIGDEWEVVDEGFPYMKLLLLERLKIRYWRASCDHFPCLERLFLERCLGLDSIPQDFADITTLALINISSCAESVGNSAKQIQQDIQDNYGTSVEVTIFRPVKANNIYFS